MMSVDKNLIPEQLQWTWTDFSSLGMMRLSKHDGDLPFQARVSLESVGVNCDRSSQGSFRTTFKETGKAEITEWMEGWKVM